MRKHVGSLACLKGNFWPIADVPADATLLSCRINGRRFECTKYRPLKLRPKG
jgi:hypothetical protein